MQKIRAMVSEYSVPFPTLCCDQFVRYQRAGKTHIRISSYCKLKPIQAKRGGQMHIS